MQKVPYRIITLLLSILGAVLFCYFLFSPVLLLPADSHFVQLTIGRPSILIEGESWVPIYGLQLVMKIGLENILLLALVMFSAMVALCLSPFIALMSNIFLLNSIVISAILNLLLLSAVIIVFTPYLKSAAIASGCVAMLMLLAALLFRRKTLKFSKIVE